MQVVKELRPDLREQVLQRLKVNALRLNVIFSGCTDQVQ